MKLETNVPRVIFGTMNFGRQLDETAADRMLGIFLDLGYEEIDTAYNYANRSGRGDPGPYSDP